MDNLPEKITDITNEEVLTGLLVKMSKCGPREPREPYTIKNGFIYFSDPYFNGESQLLLIQTTDIQEMYKEYKQSACTSRININFNRIGQWGNYLMYNSTFNLITSAMQIRIIGNLIFCADDSLSYIVQTDTGYYCVPSLLWGDIKHYTPVKFNYMIRILKKVHGERVFTLVVNIIDDEVTHRHAIDPYEACDALFICADTYDIVNVETGDRIPTWPLVYKNIVPRSLLSVEDEINSIGCICPEIDDSCLPIRSALTFYDSKWNIHYLRINFGEFQELRRISSGKATKAAASVAAAEVE